MRPFLQLASAEDAYRTIGGFPALAIETIDARRAAGRVIAEVVRALEDVPSFTRSNMDGFAVIAADTASASDTSSVLLEVIGQVSMGRIAAQRVEPGTAIRVSTGAMLPAGADAVVMVEKTDARSNGRKIAIHEPLVRGQNLIQIAEDLTSGDVLFEPGRRVKGGDVGALTGAGHGTVTVHVVPRVGVLATGDEIVEPGVPLEPGQVRNVNEYSLASLSGLLGARVNDYGVCPDDQSRLSEILERAVGENDVVFVSGGSSKGDRDLTRAAFESVGAEILLHGIAIAPGKPTIIARTRACALVGLPGNPAAAVVVFTLFGSALVRVLEGESLERILMTRAITRARLDRSVTSTQGREDYVRVRLERRGQETFAVALMGKSVTISTIARADGLLRVPLACDGIEAGTEVDILLL